MPPRSARREAPADVIGNAVLIMRIATGEETETLPADDGKDAANSFATEPLAPVSGSIA
jgi:hypothetical protein